MKTLAPLLLLMIALILGSGSSAIAQDTTATADTRREAIDRLIVVLDDAELRGEILTQLRAMAAAPDGASVQAAGTTDTLSTATPGEVAAEPGLIDSLSKWSTDLVTQLPTTTFGVPIDQKALQAGTQVSTRIEVGLREGLLLNFAIWAVPGLVVIIVAGLGLRRLGRRLTAPTRPVRKLRLAGGLLLKSVGYIGLFIGEAIVLGVLAPNAVGSHMFLTLSVGILLAMFVTDIAISALSALAGVRGVRIVNYCQRRFWRWWFAILLLAIFSSLCRDPELRRVVGWSAADLAAFAFNLIAAGVTLLFIVRHRLAIGRLIFGSAAHIAASNNPVLNATRQLARRWHLLTYAFLALSVVSLVAGQRDNDVFSQTLWSFGTVLLAFVAASLSHRLFSNLLGQRRRSRGAVRQAVMGGVFRALRIGLNIAIGLGAVMFIAEIWGFRLWGWLWHEGQPLTQPLFAAGICAFVAWLIWVALDAWIASALTPTDALGRPRQRSNRSRTLLPLVRNGSMILLVLLAGIAVLANIGVDVTPLLAGAGVFGLALSFGSQQLVQDVITGIFILAEDTIAVGDTINTGDRSGVVEGISLRTIRLRDADGALHSIPFSTVKALKNSSRNFGVFRPRYSVPASADPERVLDLMRETASELRANPKYSSSIMSDMQNLGIEEINPGSVVVSGSFRTTPLRQTELARAFNWLFREKLTAAGIAL